MEIISYVLEGFSAHKDSEGHVSTLAAGEFRLMSPVSGIPNSEYKHSQHQPLKFLPMWIQPNVQGQTAGWQQ
jgi:redox-sensitive bicupin YhaK (pirin superfamily)